MNTISDEQRIIVENIKKGYNVVVDACAGSGKSTTILSTAIAMPDKRFLQITYNKSLRKEIKDKVLELGLQNIVVHTYHSLAVAKYSSDAHTDTGIRNIINKEISPLSAIMPQDVIVIDETQDMTFLYFQLIVKYTRDMGTPFLLMVLGDYMQGLYEFKGADIRFLTHAEDIWKGFPLLKSQEFMKCTLKMSYRITNQMADFVNKGMLGNTRLYACKEGEPIYYLRRDSYKSQNKVIQLITELLAQGANPSDIFVLGGSVKGTNSQIRRIENALSNLGIPCHVPMIDGSDKIDEKVIDGKVVFSSFHCVKGRQRPYVFIIGFDNSYFDYYAKTLDPKVCPNTLYVASTRATKKMVVLERNNDWKNEMENNDRPLPFLKMNHCEMKKSSFVEFNGLSQILFPPIKKEDRSSNRELTTPTKLIEFTAESILEEISPLLDSIFIKESDNHTEIDIPTIIKTKKGFYEDVSELNGHAIPSMYYDYINSKWSKLRNMLYDMIQTNMLNEENMKDHGYLKTIIENLSPDCENIGDYLYLANVLEAINEKLYFKLKQIDRDEYDWLSPNVLSQCKERLMTILEAECNISQPKTEETIIYAHEEDKHIRIDECLRTEFPDKKIRFTARIDLMTQNCVWELKCTSAITQDHLLQVVIYAWLMRTMNPLFSKEFRIFNIKTGEVLKLQTEKDVLDKIVLSLLRGKYGKIDPPTDMDFIEDCQKCIR